MLADSLTVKYGVEIKSQIIEKAGSLGFRYCGFGPVEPFDELKAFYSDYLASGRQASMTYIERYAPERLDPRRLMPEAKSVIALLFNYYPPEIIPPEDNFIIAKYAYGRDDHKVVKERLRQLVDFLENFLNSRISRAFFDSGVLLEKALARRCGAGWIGKNTLLINRDNGSFFLIGIILTDLEIEPDIPGTDHCGKCDLCMKACPTGAIDAPYQLNIARCISYLTIETKHPVPDQLLSGMSDRIYGCDICQDVCPFNKFAVPHSEPAFFPKEDLKKMRKGEWNQLTESVFENLFKDSSLKRIGYQKLMSTIEGISRKGEKPPL